MKTSITVFTPAYNRAYILPKLYESLLIQDYPYLEWLVVDDGSVDNTEELISNFIKENKINIRYFKQKNGGKQRAMNLGFEKCETDLFMCVDSDDHLTKDSIKKIIKKWETDYNNNSKIAGIISMRGKSETEPLNKYLPDVFSTKHRLLYTKYHFIGDLDIIYKTSILKNYKYFVFDDEKFMGETYVYNKIDDNYDMLIMNEITSICNYLPDGYTKNVRKLLKNNPKGYRLLKHENAIRSDTFYYKFTGMIKYVIADIMCHDGQGFKMCKMKGYYILSYLPGWLAYFIFYSRA